MSSRSYNYSVAKSENSKSSYQSYDNLEFVIIGDPNMSLLKNSIRLEADVSIKVGGNLMATGDKVYMDNLAGGHSLISSIRTNIQNGQIENIEGDYARYVKMSALNLSPNDVINSSYSVEGRQPHLQMMKSWGEGQTTSNAVGQTFTDAPSVSFRPRFCLNQMSGNLSFQRVGQIRVYMVLERDLGALWGWKADGTNLSYELTNVKLSFIQVPFSPLDNNPVMCKNVIRFKQTLSSSQAQISAKVPSACNSVTMSFQKLGNEYTLRNNNLRCDNLDNLQSVAFNYNDVLSNGILYEITDRGEMLRRAADSMFHGDKHSGVNTNRWGGSNAFILGYNFEMNRDLTNSKFNTLLKCDDVNNTNQYQAYLYFHSQISV